MSLNLILVMWDRITQLRRRNRTDLEAVFRKLSVFALALTGLPGCSLWSYVGQSPNPTLWVVNPYLVVWTYLSRNYSWCLAFVGFVADHWSLYNWQLWLSCGWRISDRTIEYCNRCGGSHPHIYIVFRPRGRSERSASGSSTEPDLQHALVADLNTYPTPTSSAKSLGSERSGKDGSWFVPHTTHATSSILRRSRHMIFRRKGLAGPRHEEPLNRSRNALMHTDTLILRQRTSIWMITLQCPR